MITFLLNKKQLKVLQLQIKPNNTYVLNLLLLLFVLRKIKSKKKKIKKLEILIIKKKKNLNFQLIYLIFSLNQIIILSQYSLNYPIRKLKLFFTFLKN